MRNVGTVAALIVSMLLLPVLIIVLVLASAGDTEQASFDHQCGLSAPAQTPFGDANSIGEWSPEQVENAMYIMHAGADMGLTRRDQEIAVTTAIGESTLIVLDHGDDAGPDSRGLFQQRDNGAWGTYDDRMDPYKSAEMFFEQLSTIDNRDALSITEAAHRVQGNQDPNHYASYESDGRDLVASILEGDTDEEAAVDPCPVGAAATGEGVPDQSTLGEPSADIACPDDTTDLGVHDGAYQGDRISIRLCSIPETVCTGSDCRSGELGGLARGEVVINSRFAPYFMDWLESIRETGTPAPHFSSSFRSWASQDRISGGGSNSNAATIGNSHHQTGGAVDVSGLPGIYSKGQCTGTAPDGSCMTDGDLWPVLHSTGLEHGITVHDQEFWHFEFLLSGASRGRDNPFL